MGPPRRGRPYKLGLPKFLIVCEFARQQFKWATRLTSQAGVKSSPPERVLEFSFFLIVDLFSWGPTYPLTAPVASCERNFCGESRRYDDGVAEGCESRRCLSCGGPV